MTNFRFIPGDLILAQEAGLILHGIWSQWDFENECSLPEGVDRIWNAEQKKEEIVWSKTGDPYDPLIPSPTVSTLGRTLSQLRRKTSRQGQIRPSS